MSRPPLNRVEMLSRLDEPFDVAIIGGGATGLGVAVDCAARGYRTLLVEARDFGQGTSSRSTKLAHGGVRYLRQGNIALVRDALREREIMAANAPHLVREQRFLIPALAAWEKPFYGLGLKVYDALAGRTRMGRSRIVAGPEAEGLAPALIREGLRGGVLYSDGQFDDARMAMALARTAADLGAVLLNACRATALRQTGGRVSGLALADIEGGGEMEVRARAVVNATGAFADAIRRMDDPGAVPIIAASQGSHIVFDSSFMPGDTALMIPRTADGRVVFLIPWHGRVLAGTTDIPVDGPSDEPAPRDDEIAFILEHAGRYLRRRPGRADILAAFAGLRPLVKGRGRTADLSRDHTLLVSPSGLVTITGGKWTTYRRMAGEATDAAARVAGLPVHPCPTRHLTLWGADAPPGPWREFGVLSGDIRDYERRFPGVLHPRLPYTRAMAAAVTENEMPNHLEDVLSRRLRALLLDARAAVEAAPEVAALMASLLGRDAAWMRREIAAFTRLARTYWVET